MESISSGVDFFETFSPMVKPSTIRVIVSLAVTYGWDIQQVDINMLSLIVPCKRKFL